ncbi:MAG: proteasome assembly chaperone family protein, partial [Candidatus Heimdallarchaeota archaeon]
MKFKIFQEKPKILDQCRIFIGGWHGLGEIGYITVSHLINELKMKRIATIMSSGAPPFISVQDNQLKLPFEIYGDEKLDFAVFIPHLQPYRHVQIEFSEKLSEWILNQNFEIALFIGGVDIRLKTSDNPLQFIPSRAFYTYSHLPDGFAEEVRLNLLDSGLFVAGPLAIMLGYLDMNMFSAVGILAYAERERPDPLGAVAAIE